jgi:hypothetical protein
MTCTDPAEQTVMETNMMRSGSPLIMRPSIAYSPAANCRPGSPEPLKRVS